MTVQPESELTVRVKEPYSEQVAQILRRSILSGHYGPGQRLNEVEISTSLGISRSPIREGLRKLADEGLVVLKPGRGAFVASFAATEVQELMELRQALDVMAARLAAQRATEAQMADIQRSLEAATAALKGGEPVPPWSSDFHLLILRASGNRRIAERGAEVHQQLRLVRFRSGSSADRTQEAHDEHQAILDAIRARDVELAGRRMQDHLAAAAAHISRVVQTDHLGADLVS
ncbi:MAG: GntR family transcriptional regulator [Micromonosporaceae bacterium]